MKNYKIAGCILLVINWLIATEAVLAHHPMGGKIPANFGEGFGSGLGHPVIGIDHLVFIITIGLVATTFNNKLGIVIPLIFTMATTVGTGIHFLNLDLPFSEIIIATSIAGFGILLAKNNRHNLVLITIISAIAGIFHGYAYGEAIVGAETTALTAYLLGFCLIQLIISVIAYYIGQLMIQQTARKANLSLRYLGMAICSIGIVFLSQAII